MLWSEQGHQGRVLDRSRSIIGVSGLKEITGWWVCNIFWRYCKCSDTAHSILGKTRLILLGWIFNTAPGQLEWVEVQSSWRYSRNSSTSRSWKQEVFLQGPRTVPYVTITMRVERGTHHPCFLSLFHPVPARPYLLLRSSCAASAGCSQCGTGCSINVQHSPGFATTENFSQHKNKA